MKQQGNHRLAWQQGNVALYADVAVKLDRDEDSDCRVRGIEALPDPWQHGVRFGVSLVREALSGIVNLDDVVVSITAFRGQPGDTTLAAAAYATFHAVADALQTTDASSVFRFDDATGRFEIAIPESSESL